MDRAAFLFGLGKSSVFVLIRTLMQEVKDESEHYAKLESIGFDVGKRMLLRSDIRIASAHCTLLSL